MNEDFIGAGNDLSVGTILAAYRHGLFPMPIDHPEAPVGWWSPQWRGILPLGGLRVSKSLAKSRRTFDIRIDTAFEEVLDACADPSRDGSWIDADIRTAYLELHEGGYAHSVEAWRDGKLAGGLYGVAIGGLFAGESMFHHERDASKVALMGLVELLSEGEVPELRLLDTQWQTPHLATLGVVEIARDDYLRRLRVALELPLPPRLRP